jgi:outer membrane cobalamin receptor
VARYWVGVRPFFELPDLEGHLERTSVASARVGQGPELASISGEGGLEIRPVSAMEVRAEANVRRSRGLLHLQRDEAGTYALANLDPRLIVDVGASAALTVVPGLVARAGYDLKIVEGTDPSYVAPYRGDVGITFRTWPVEVSGGVRYLGERHGGPTEGDLAGTWLAEAGVEVELASRWRVRAWGENLTDEEYREYGEYEARGRYIEAGVRYAF